MNETCVSGDESAVQTAQAWYQEPFVWLVIAIPASSVLVAIVLIVLAVESYDGLVVDDYYRRGLQINQTLDRDRTATELGIRAHIEFSQTTQLTTVTLSARDSGVIPEPLKLNFFHVSRQGLDHSVALRRVSDTVFVAPLLNLPPGRWHAQLETDTWRLVETVTSPQAGGFTLDARPDG